MELALRADKQIGFEIFAECDGAAVLALGPETFRADAALFRRSRLINRLLLPLKPSHLAIFSSCGHRLHPSQPTPFRPCSNSLGRVPGAPGTRLIVYTTLSENALGVRMFDFFHFGNQVGEFDEFGMSVATSANNVDAFGTIAQRVDDHFRFQHFVADDVVDLIENDEIVFSGVDGIAARVPAFFREPDVCGISLRAANFDESAPHRANFKFVVTKHFGGVEFAIVPRALDKLHHQYAQALAYRAKCRTERTCGFPFARPGINDQESLFLRHFAFSKPFSRTADQKASNRVSLGKRENVNIA